MEIELDGKCVIHKTFGKGVVLDFDGSYLEVDFEEAGKKCKFQYALFDTYIVSKETG